MAVMGAVFEIEGAAAQWVSEGYALDVMGRLWTYWWSRGPKSGGGYEVRSLTAPRLMRPRPNEKGYCRYQLRRAGDSGYLHRLMWKTWYGEDPGSLQVRHWDGNPGNNALSNLMIGTQIENEADKLRHGTRALGSDSCRAILTDAEVLAARHLYAHGLSLPKVIKRLNLTVSHDTIWCAVTGRTWAHLNEAA